MNKRPGHVVVTTEVGFCSFCGRPRNLRNEQHQLGALVRTIVTCESCHRTLSSSVGVATDEAATAEPVAAETEEVADAPAAPAPAKTSAKSKPASRAAKTTASKSTTSKSATKKKSG